MKAETKLKVLNRHIKNLNICISEAENDGISEAANHWKFEKQVFEEIKNDIERSNT